MRRVAVWILLATGLLVLGGPRLGSVQAQVREVEIAIDGMI